MFGILAERMYNLADVTEEGVEHYLPRLTHWATNYNLTTENTFGLLSAENYITEEDVAADLAQVRALSTFADRGAVLNDLLRKQVRRHRRRRSIQRIYLRHQGRSDIRDSGR